MENALSPDVLEARKYGRFYDKEGAVFPEFSSANIIVPFDTAALNEKFISIDPGYTNPTAVLWLAKDANDNIYVTADYEVSYKTVAEHSEAIKQKTETLGWKLADIKILIDSAAKQRTSSCDKSTAAQYRENGINADANVNKSVFAGIMKIKALFCNSLNKRRLFVFRSCTNLINEIHGYYWSENDNPQKQNDHTVDALRYCIMYIAQTEPLPKPKNQIGFLGLVKRSLLNSNNGVHNNLRL
jgi:phage terminase large subunit